MEGSFHIVGGDFSNAGKASTELKTILTNCGLDIAKIRRAVIATFEGEMNIIIYAVAGTITYEIQNGKLLITLQDIGPGIKNIELAMTEGYSTAPDWVREMGWGAGMGLPNMKKNADIFKINSIVGEGTTVEIIINLY
ncbi:MAG: anti-sigma regulatory factor [Nitrospirae bacterium]|nr:anti-sigma regulatory factor [Nitrospirota bacterium]MBF0541856.1 anti-sigma regulatory factor [Nitrospirota bacterium]